jgi:hypothetical protein
MTYDIETFYQLILAGFITVWTYRHTSRKPLKHQPEFEYLGLSAFWGLAILLFMAWTQRRNPEYLEGLLTNPYASGAVFSFLGGMLGTSAAQLHSTSPTQRLIGIIADKCEAWRVKGDRKDKATNEVSDSVPNPIDNTT